MFRSSEPEEFSAAALRNRIPSYVQTSKVEGKAEEWKQSVQIWHEEVYDFGKYKSPNETAQEVTEAGTTSVLACLQSPIQADQIISQVMRCSRKAMLRLSAFRMIDMLLEYD